MVSLFVAFVVVNVAISCFVIVYITRAVQASRSVSHGGSSDPGRIDHGAGSPPSSAETASSPVAAKTADPPGSESQGAAPHADPLLEAAAKQIQEVLHWLHQAASTVDDHVVVHTAEMDQINRTLEATNGGDPKAVLASVSQILKVNDRLRSELAASRSEISEQKRQVDKLLAESRTDSLTGLANRRSLEDDLSRRFDEWRRRQKPLSLIMFDIDHFKNFNDTYGHQAGDSVLREVAVVVNKNLREMDVHARYGGEEFAVVLPDTPFAAARNVAERVRATVESHIVRHGIDRLKVTISVGLAEAIDDPDYATLVRRADAALYAAKKAGRNRVYSHTGRACEPAVADHAVVRHDCHKTIRVAPYQDGVFPEQGSFREVQCLNISANGFSFIDAAPPPCNELVVELTDGAPRFVTASVRNATQLEEESSCQYRMGCQFTGTVQREAEPELAAI